MKKIQTLRDYVEKPVETYVIWFTNHQDGELKKETFTLDRKVLEDGEDFEWMYSLLENGLKQLSELGVGESFAFQEERDDARHYCLVIRVK